MAQNYSPRIIQDGLVLCLDPSQNKSYPSSDLPIKDGLVMWMDAADDTTFSYSSGTTVTQWRDKSGFGYDMVPKVSGPTRSSFLNSRKVLAFTTAQTIGNNTINLASSANTVFVVSRLTGVTNGRVLTCNLDSSGNNWLLGHHGGTANDYYAEGWVYDAASAINLTSWKIFMGDWSGSSTDLANFYTDGTILATNSSAASQGPNKLGVNYFSNETSTCEVAEIIVFNRVLSTAERRLVDTYLGQKWGISNTDRSIIDLSGNDDNGLFGAGTTTYMPSFDYYNKGSLRFDGSDDYVDLGTNSTLINLTNNITVEAWIKTSFPNNRYTIYGNGYTGTGMMFGTSANTPGGLEVYYPGIYVAYSTGGVLQADVWQHVVYTRNGSGLNTHAFYINGVSQAVTQTANGGDSWGTSGTNRYLGLRGGVMFNGQMSTVKVYNRALSSSEVTQNYESQKSRFANTIVQNGLILNLDAGNPYSYAGTGTTWFDVSGNNYTGSLTNGPIYSTVNNGVIVFDGNNDYIDITTATVAVSGNGARSIFVWMKTTAGGLIGFVSTGTPTNSQAFNLVKYSGGVGVMGYNNDYYPAAGAAGVTLNDGNWHYIGATFDGTNIRTYADGKLDNTSGTFTFSTTGQNNYIGRSNHTGNENFLNGSIGLTQIYNRALSTAEVLQNYNATKNRFGL